jgi:small multidrug resistance family-3 protein
MKIFLFVLAATVFEAAGDAIVRIALHQQYLFARIGFFLLGYTLLALYGTSLNLAPVEFASVTGVYVATLFLVFQVVNFIFFGVPPTPAVLVGGAFIVIGGLTVALLR